MYKERAVVFSKDIIEFFKRHGLYNQKVFDYIKSHTMMFDMETGHESIADATGFGPHRDPFTHKFDGFFLCMPYPNDAKTKLINVNLITKGIIAYKYLNRYFNEEYRLEALGFLYEELFARESSDPEILKQKNIVNESVDENSDERYQFALFAQDYLIDSYEDDIDKMFKLSKNLSKIYKREHK